jgi:hypothetical protein
MNPKAKTNLLVEELPDESLVYDLDRHRAHCLNRSAALILSHADGSRDVPTLVDALSAAMDEPVTTESVQVGLDRLRTARLLEWDGKAPLETGVSRREALREMARAGLVLPSVLTVAAAQGPPGTRITPAACRKDAVNLGRCCTNKRLCVQQGNRRTCSGPPC